MDPKKQAEQNHSSKCDIPIKTILGSITVLGCLAAGIVVGYYFERIAQPPCAEKKTILENPQSKLDEITERVSAKNIEANLKLLTKYPHFAGGDINEKLGTHLYHLWMQQGLDEVKSHQYNIYLSYSNKPSRIIMRYQNAITADFIIDNEPPLDESERNGSLPYPYFAFSPKKSVTGEVVYGNYGSLSDFDLLDKLGINVKGKIMLLRNGGGVSKGAKARLSHLRGCLGMIVYSDPADQTTSGEAYPKGWLMNGDAISRGSVNNIPEDALSIGYPSKDGYWRKTDEQGYPLLQQLPSQPISANQASHIFSMMRSGNTATPPSWIGALNSSYPLQSGVGVTLTLDIDTRRETRLVQIICGKLYGSVERDRYVVWGNHRDSWLYGAADASSGGAVMMEIVRVLAEAKKTAGWRPRRSLMFCSWDAHEFGLLGTEEWIQEHRRFVQSDVVAYLNVDMAVEGNFTLRIKALQHIKDSLFRQADLMLAPDRPHRTLLEDWREKSALLANMSLSNMHEPLLELPSSGSDYKAFWTGSGITVVDYRYLFSKIDFPLLDHNPQYHSRYDSFGWMKRFVDPTFKYHDVIARLMLRHGVSIAEAAVIPFDLEKYCEQLQSQIVDCEAFYMDYLKEESINLDLVKERLKSLRASAKKFMEKIRSEVSSLTPLQLRAVNDRIMTFEQNFILEGIDADAPDVKHVIYGNPKHSLRGAPNGFPGIARAVYNVINKITQDWDDVRKQITLVAWCIDTAIQSLEI